MQHKAGCVIPFLLILQHLMLKRVKKKLKLNTFYAQCEMKTLHLRQMLAIKTTVYLTRAHLPCATTVTS